jgi:hypothetical protein
MTTELSRGPQNGGTPVVAVFEVVLSTPWMAGKSFRFNIAVIWIMGVEKIIILVWTAWPWTGRHYDLSKHRKPLA